MLLRVGSAALFILRSTSISHPLKIYSQKKKKKKKATHMTQIMKQKLLYAIHECQAIDMDFDTGNAAIWAE
jgi:hypothetical protein